MPPENETGQETVFSSEVVEGPRPRRTSLGWQFFSKRILSLSVEGTSLRLLSMAGGSVETWASVPLQPKWLQEGYVANVHGLAQAMAEAVNSRNMAPGRLVCGFTSLGSFSRTLSLPEAARKSLAGIVPRELRRAAINPDTYNVYYQILPGTLDQLHIYVLGVPKEPLVAIVKALRLARLKPAAIDLKPLALARAVNREDAIIAHGERDSLEVAVMVDQVPSLHSAYLGSETSPQQVAERLTEELGHSIDLYNSAHRENPLNSEIPIYLTGEMAGYPGLADNLAATLGRRIAPLDPPLKLPERFPLATFMVNIGLVLKKI